MNLAETFVTADTIPIQKVAFLNLPSLQPLKQCVCI